MTGRGINTGESKGDVKNLPDTHEIRRLRGRLSLILEDVEFGRVYDSTVVFRLLGYVRPHWKLATLSILTMFLYIGTQISVPFLVGTAINQFIKSDDFLSTSCLFFTFKPYEFKPYDL